MAALPAFDAVSVRSFKPNRRPWNHDAVVDPQRLTIEGMLPISLIAWAYDVEFDQIQGMPRLKGDPWYAITGETSKPVTPDQMRLMLRRVLAERFHLRFTVTDAIQPVYALEVAPGGPKLKLLKPGTPCLEEVDRSSEIYKSAHAPSNALVTFEGCRIATLVQRLNIAAGLNNNRPSIADLPVIDKTGLTRLYSIVLWQTGRLVPTSARTLRVDYQQTLQDALKRELGLELVRTTAPWRILHITHIGPPTAN